MQREPQSVIAAFWQGFDQPEKNPRVAHFGRITGTILTGFLFGVGVFAARALF